MGDRSAFFYGTLMVPQVLYRVCYGSSKPTSFQANLLTIMPAILPAFTRHKVRDCDYPAIIPSSSSSSVRGTYVRGLTDGDIWRLNTFEGRSYERQKVMIRILQKVGNDIGQGNVEGEQVEVETYVWIGGRDALEDDEWDFAEFKRDKLKWWVDADDEYEEIDEAVETADVDLIDESTTSQMDNLDTEDALKSAV